MKKIIAIAFLSIFATSAFAKTVACSGTEPFWGVKVKNSKIYFSNPAIDGTEVLSVLSTTQAAGFSDDFAFVVKSRYARLTVIAGACSDGMSDNTYSHNALFETDSGITFAGCCNIEE